MARKHERSRRRRNRAGAAARDRDRAAADRARERAADRETADRLAAADHQRDRRESTERGRRDRRDRDRRGRGRDDHDHGKRDRRDRKPAWSGRRWRPAETGFWAGFEVSWAKWVVVRVTLFGVLAADAFVQMGQASRYGAGGFNVQHLPGAPLPDPGRVTITTLHAVLCLAFALIAQGVLVRVLLPVSAVLYGYTYFSSQLDSSQHHYLLWLLLVLLSFVPVGSGPPPAGRTDSTAGTVRSWALRLVLAQLGVMYLWAAVANVDRQWLDGTALAAQLRPGAVRDAASSLGFSTVAIAVLAAQAFLAVAVWHRRLWPVALPIGLGLHAGAALGGLDSGRAAYLMFALYLLLVPDHLFLTVNRYRARLAGRVPRISRRARVAMVALAAALTVIGWTLIVDPFGGARATAVAAALLIGLVALDVVSGRGARTWALAVAVAVPLVLSRATDVPAHYYRTWADDSRRLGLPEQARAAYRGLLRIDPGSGYAHYHLGEAALTAGNLDGALDHFQRARRSSRPGPDQARTYRGEAVVHLRRDQVEAARAALETALRLDPGDRQASELLGALSSEAPTESIPGVPIPPSPADLTDGDPSSWPRDPTDPAP